MEKLYEHTLRRQAIEIAGLKSQNAEILAKMDRLLAREPGAAAPGPALPAVQVDARMYASVGKTVNTQVNNTITIHIHGKESINHITRERMQALLDEALQAPAMAQSINQAVMKTAMLVYSDPDHPENLTCYLPNKKTNDALVHARDGWEVRPTSLVLPEMAQKSVDTIFDKQPHENVEAYGLMLRDLINREADYIAGADLRPVLVRNKDLLTRALKTLPAAGSE